MLFRTLSLEKISITSCRFLFSLSLSLSLSSNLLQAEKLLKKLQATKNLHDATISRQLTALEQAIGAVKKGGWEKDLQREMQEATALLEKVKVCNMSLFTL